MNRIPSSIVLAAALGLLALEASAVSAQTTFTACRVPDVGAIYMIGVTGAPSECLDASHVEFSWTEGSGGVGAGDIGTTELADDAVTSAKILDGSIGAADLSAGAVLEPGVEFTADALQFDPTTTATTAGSVTVSHPASGYLVTSAQGQINCSAASSLALGLTTDGTVTSNMIYEVPATGNYTMVFHQEVIPVTGSGTATVNFNIDMFSDNCTFFRARRIAAVWVPVRY